MIIDGRAVPAQVRRLDHRQHAPRPVLALAQAALVIVVGLVVVLEIRRLVVAGLVGVLEVGIGFVAGVRHGPGAGDRRDDGRPARVGGRRPRRHERLLRITRVQHQWRQAKHRRVGVDRVRVQLHPQHLPACVQHRQRVRDIVGVGEGACPGVAEQRIDRLGG